MSETNGVVHDLLTESPVPLDVLRQIVGRKYGVRKSWKRWYYWQHRERTDTGEFRYGARTHDGRRVVMETIYIGGVIYSTEAAWLRFQAAQNEGRE